jgi:DNA primase|tara:strand:- start:532 stop:1470 length:939 start_codon:yes stop_codon:yes gene_type:complete
MNKIINLLNRVLNSNGTKLKKQDEYMYWSPFTSHHKPKLQINIQNGNWHCWVSNMGGRNLFQLLSKIGASKSNFDELIELVGDVPRYIKKDNASAKVVQLPTEFKPLWNGGDSIVKRHALSYLYKRGIDDSDILKYNIGYCVEGSFSNRIIIPSYDSEGQLNFFVGRDFYDSKMKYRNSPTSKDIIGFDLFINWDEPIILCEGVFDAMSFKRNAIPLFGKTVMNALQKKIIEFKVKVIYLSLDSDAITDAIKISENFTNNGIEVKMMKFQEKDPNEIGFEKLLYLIKKTQTIRFSDLMKMKLNGTRKKHMEI